MSACGWRTAFGWRTSTSPRAATSPDRDVNPKFGQKLDFVERMTAWSASLDCPTILVGDLNIAPLECDVWSHKATAQRRQPHAGRGRCAQPAQGLEQLGRSRPAFPSGAGAAAHVVELSLARLDGQRPRAAARSYVGDRGCRGDRHIAHGVRSVPQLAQAVRPCPDPDRVRPVSARDVARAIDSLRRGWPIAIRGAGEPVGLLAIETADAGRLAAFDPQSDSPILLSAGRAATLKLANQIEAADPRFAGAGRAHLLDRFRLRGGAGRPAARHGDADEGAVPRDPRHRP